MGECGENVDEQLEKGANHGLERPCAVTALRDASISL